MCERRREFELLFQALFCRSPAEPLLSPFHHIKTEKDKKKTQFLERDQGVFGMQPVGGFFCLPLSAARHQTHGTALVVLLHTTEKKEKQSRKSSLSNISTIMIGQHGAVNDLAI